MADFGGGFGGLARFIGAALPQASVDVVEPHPHPATIALAADTPNVRFVPELSGDYDLLIATDVFEHVPNPIALAASTASHLRVGGSYLIANCFAPVIAPSASALPLFDRLESGHACYGFAAARQGSIWARLQAYW